MNKFLIKVISILLVTFIFSNCETQKEETKDTFVEDNYTKIEVDIPMRDGIKLHTTIYSPKDQSK